MNSTSGPVNRWMRWLHIYSAVPVLISMIFFAVTGFFLNHPDWSPGQTRAHELSLILPDELASIDWQASPSIFTLGVLQWLDREQGIRGVKMEVEWEDDELLIITLEGPSTTQTVEVLPDEGEVEVFALSLPLMAMLNNLHRGKQVSDIWRLFSDLSAIFMLVFCLTGLWLVCVNRMQRVTAGSWVAIGGGLFFVIVYLMH
ncbi:PepSY-associated TM helix domain-containing protein [Nitrincola alkalilacustris]|uniref:PepSY-associated TM helix domain-containing protein n=1 Tax=Nitrincola alkalilacustris TaxID=1571224 RepID=UPI00124E6DBC|nr:PepSY-associated TM helix domain-containing protein [Nitrincola alkalilacustris]